MLWMIFLEKDDRTFFSEADYASNAWKTRLALRHFDQSFIFAHTLQHIYFDEEHAVDDFLVKDDKKDVDEAEFMDDLSYPCKSRLDKQMTTNKDG